MVMVAAWPGATGTGVPGAWAASSGSGSNRPVSPARNFLYMALGPPLLGMNHVLPPGRAGRISPGRRRRHVLALRASGHTVRAPAARPAGPHQRTIRALAAVAMPWCPFKGWSTVDPNGAESKL